MDGASTGLTAVTLSPHFQNGEVTRPCASRKRTTVGPRGRDLVGRHGGAEPIQRCDREAGRLQVGLAVIPLELATHEFQEGLKNYRDLNYLHRNLDGWQQNVDVFANMLETQKEKLAQVKTNRDAKQVAQALQAIGGAIDQNENLMPHIIKAVKCYASIGEICGVMREKWGEYSPPIYI